MDDSIFGFSFCSPGQPSTHDILSGATLIQLPHFRHFSSHFPVLRPTLNSSTPSLFLNSCFMVFLSPCSLDFLRVVAPRVAADVLPRLPQYSASSSHQVLVDCSCLRPFVAKFSGTVENTP